MAVGEPAQWLTTLKEIICCKDHIHTGATIQNRRYSADFGAPATIPKLAKLYTISLCRNLLYVGITHGRMSQRLGGGLRASGEHGYHGYKLNDGDFSLNIWTGGPEMGREDMESIEAEVAFEWRKRSAQWPGAQNQIHFHQTNAGHREAARLVLRKIAREPLQA